jgi:hypothetical protein
VAAMVTAHKAAYEGLVCPTCDRVARAYRAGHDPSCEFHHLNAPVSVRAAENEREGREQET